MKKNIDFDKVADLYDVYVDTAFDVPFYINEAGKIPGDILELMAGTGRITIELLKAGRNVTCVDYGEKMLERLAEKTSQLDNKPDIRLQDVTGLKLEKKFDLVLMPFNSICEILNQQKQFQTLLNVKEHLKTGGTFICATQNPVVRFRNNSGMPKVLGKFEYGDNHDLIITIIHEYHHINNFMTGWQFYEIYDKNHILKEKRYIELKQKPVFYQVMCEMCKAAGFRIENVYGNYNYGKFDEEKSEFMIFNTKKN